MTGVSPSGAQFQGEGVACNISARGLFGRCKEPPEVGTRLQVYISIPFGAGKRIKYSAQVVRVETGIDAAIALTFDKARPVFNEEPEQERSTLTAISG